MNDSRNRFKLYKIIPYILLWFFVLSYDMAYAGVKKYRLYKRYVKKDSKKKIFGDTLTDNYYVGVQIDLGMSLGTMLSGFSKEVPIPIQLDHRRTVHTRGKIHLKANIPYSIGVFAKYRPINWLGFELVSAWCPITGIVLKGLAIIDNLSNKDTPLKFICDDVLPLKYTFKTTQFEHSINVVFHQGEFFETLGLKFVNIGPTSIEKLINYNKLGNPVLQSYLELIFGKVDKKTAHMHVTSPNITRIHPYFTIGLGYEFDFGLGFDIKAQLPLKIGILTQYAPKDMQYIEYWEKLFCTNNNLFITSLIFFSKSIFEISIRCNGLKSYFYFKKRFG